MCVYRHCTVLWHKWPVHDLMLVMPLPPLIKVASNTRPCSKLGGTTLNGREEGDQYHISQTWECLYTFATGCSAVKFSLMEQITSLQRTKINQ